MAITLTQQDIKSLLAEPNLSEEDKARIQQSMPQTGLLSSVGQGARGILGVAGAALKPFAESLAARTPQMIKDMQDTQRFYEMERMKQPTIVPISQLGQLRQITPAGIAAGLDQYRAAERLALQEPELKKLEAMAALERAKGTGSLAAQKTSPKTFLLPDGKSVVETYFDKISGQRLISGTNEPLPVGSLEFGPADVPTFENLFTFEEKVTEEESKLIALDKYKNALKNAPEGLGRTLQAMNMIIKTLPSDPKFKKGDLATGEARARLQGLIGRYKDEIVGGGVMTEQDALRVIEALGGEVSAFTPSELQITLIDSFRETSERKYLSALEKYNKAYESVLPTMAGKRIFNKREAYVNPFAKASSDDDSDDIDKLLEKY